MERREYPKNPNDTYRKFYKNKYQTYEISNVYLYPIADIKFELHSSFTQEKCNYTIIGRILLEHKYLDARIKNELGKLRDTIPRHKSMEYCDNRLSKYSMQNGKCAITGEFLKAERVHCHHIIPKKLEGSDEYRNLVILSEEIHNLIHSTYRETIDRYLNELQLNVKQLKKVNTYRKKCNLEMINI